MTVALSLLAAVVYGIGDFVGGVASRERSAIALLLYAYPIGGVLMTLSLLFVPGHAGMTTVLLGIGGGLSGMVGVILMYSALAVAPMNVISPVTAVLSSIVPVAFAVAVGERPAINAWFGIVLGIVAVVAVSRTPEDHPHGRVAPRVLAMAVLAGVGFGAYFICLARSPHSSGAWPVVISRFTSAVLILPLARATKNVGLLTGRLLMLACLAGLFDASANLFFLLASRHGYLSLASVITSLYPATTVLLAAAVLHERTGSVQRLGLFLAAIAIVLITV
ncbi:MAG: DMT family transporter [Actinobacteria bacterium]|nr:DMT family transporter [Actinomycetota bacterium]